MSYYEQLTMTAEEERREILAAELREFATRSLKAFTRNALVDVLMPSTLNGYLRRNKSKRKR